MKYNLLISSNAGTYNIAGVTEAQLIKVVDAYMNKQPIVTISGRRYALENTTLFKVFTYENDRPVDEVFSYYMGNVNYRKKNSSGLYLPTSTLAKMGKDVTVDFIGDAEYGEKIKNQISEVTRRNIFDFLRVEGVRWSGRLEEIDFLSRMFDLAKLPSSDSRFESASGDIWQHRVNNFDWPDDWVYNDERFNLHKCQDSIFLNFLCELIHPIVRSDAADAAKLQQMFNEFLRTDNFEVVEKTKISGRSVFAGRSRIASHNPAHAQRKEISAILNAEYVSTQINLMEASIETSPYVSIGIAKELIETCCKKILTERGVELEKRWDLLDLMKNTNKVLQLSPSDVSDEKKASKTIRTILGSLSAVVHGICELRNEYGIGHGKPSNFKGLGPRHAKLAVGASSTLAIFLLETHSIK